MTKDYSLLGEGILLSASKWDKLQVFFLMNKYSKIFHDYTRCLLTPPKYKFLFDSDLRFY